ncbi:MAG: hypothetical protein AAGE43_06030 [Pseudomonadota bacterium]
MSDLIGSDRSLSSETQETLATLVGTIIPASTAHGVPGADDPAIFADLMASAGSVLEFLEEAMRGFAACAPTFSSASEAERLAAAEAFRAAEPEAMGLILSLISQAYYRDPRVLEALGTPARPPFPEGYEVPAGDWSLLDPVKARGPIWRET